MDRRPLPEDVARAARAYLAALVPTGDLSDAWHELLDDVAYWGETAKVPVLHLAHQVVLQHERVTPDVAALALRESGVVDPGAVATVLDVDTDTARGLVERVTGDDEDPPTASDADTPAAPRPTVSLTDDALESPGSTDRRPAPESLDTRSTADATPPATATADTDPAPGELATDSRPSASTSSLRIGFEDAPEPFPEPETGGRGWFTTRRLLVIAVVLWTVILVLWAVTGN